MQVSAWPIATVLLLGLTATAQAEPRLERIAFQFTGACTAQQRQLLFSLSTVEGVRSVDLTSVPDHALVDIDRRVLNTHDLTPIVRRMMSETSCRTEPMESCISATPLSHRADQSPSDRGRDRSR